MPFASSYEVAGGKKALAPGQVATNSVPACPQIMDLPARVASPNSGRQRDERRYVAACSSADEHYFDSFVSHNLE